VNDAGFVTMRGGGQACSVTMFRRPLLLLLPVLLGGLAVFWSSPTSNSASPTSPTAMAAAMLKAATVMPSAKHTATVIFIHGLGDTGHGWVPVANVSAYVIGRNGCWN
jgi:hypothetical protein